MSPKYYGPYRVMKRVGPVAYKLELPTSATIHPVIHISKLKHAFGDCKEAQERVPYLTKNHEWLAIPNEVFEYKKDDKGNWEAFMSWKGLPQHDATWEKYDEFQPSFPDYHIEDKVKLEQECSDRPPIIHQYLSPQFRAFTASPEDPNTQEYPPYLRVSEVESCYHGRNESPGIKQDMGSLYTP